MWTKETRLWRFVLCAALAVAAVTVCTKADEVPSESQCRPYIEKALKNLEAGDAHSGSAENNDSDEKGVDNETKGESGEKVEDDDSSENLSSIQVADEPYVGHETAEALTAEQDDSREDNNEAADDGDSAEAAAYDDANEDSKEEQGQGTDDDSGEDKDGESQEDGEDTKDEDSEENADDKSGEVEVTDKSDETEDMADDDTEKEKSGEVDDEKSEESTEDKTSKEEVDDDSKEAEDGDDSKEDPKNEDNDRSQESDGDDDGHDPNQKDDEKSDEDQEDEKTEGGHDEENVNEVSDDENSGEEPDAYSKEDEKSPNDDDSGEAEEGDGSEEKVDVNNESGEEGEKDDDDDDSSESGAPEEDLLKVGEIPENLRSRDHIAKILRLDEEASEAELTIERSADIVLRDLKRLYETAIKPLETLYKYRDLSNRHFGDPEIFSKPLVLFMGPWSGGKSSLINYLTGIEFTEWALRTGAEPSPAYFNILMYGKEPEVLDGTQLAADWTFSGLQKFGQGLEERLRGLRYPSKLLEKVNIVEIPGILEVRKQVSRMFPFNDACQWFIDRADIIFLVYDPSKLDVGPETEAILDQLKGRESQTRILLNKADTVKPEELMRVQSALIWNISPLMSSAQPPVMYTVSLWSMPYEEGAPVRLLQAQERELLKDLRTAIDRRIDNKIASARRFAVRVRNHAKMVDCYLTTYYNHKTIFGNKKVIADAIIENPQNYHIYEGLSTLTNISRYDLPDPETYRDFFRLNPVYEFQPLSATCTYFRGCPINQLDVAIAYDFPELVGKYKKMVETATPQGMPKS